MPQDIDVLSGFQDTADSCSACHGPGFPSPFLQLLSASFPSPPTHPILPLPTCRIQHFPLLNFPQLVIAHFSDLSRFLWRPSLPLRDSTAPPSSVQTANFLSFPSSPASRSLMWMLKSTGLRRVPFKCHATGLHFKNYLWF